MKNIFIVSLVIYSLQNLLPEGTQGSKLKTSDWPSKGSIKFHNVGLQYRKGLPFILKGVSFYVEPGEKIGIIFLFISAILCTFPISIFFFDLAYSNYYYYYYVIIMKINMGRKVHHIPEKHRKN